MRIAIYFNTWVCINRIHFSHACVTLVAAVLKLPLGGSRAKRKKPVQALTSADSRHPLGSSQASDEGGSQTWSQATAASHGRWKCPVPGHDQTWGVSCSTEPSSVLFKEWDPWTFRSANCRALFPATRIQPPHPPPRHPPFTSHTSHPRLTPCLIAFVFLLGQKCLSLWSKNTTIFLLLLELKNFSLSTKIDLGK